MALLRSLSAQRTAISLVYGKSNGSVAVAACRSFQRGRRSGSEAAPLASAGGDGGGGGGTGSVRYLHSGERPMQASTVMQPELVANSDTLKRHQKSSSTPAGTPAGSPQRDPLDVSFNDPIAAFKSKTTWELMRAYLVYMICSSEKLVEHNMTVSLFRPVFPLFCLLRVPSSSFSSSPQTLMLGSIYAFDRLAEGSLSYCEFFRIFLRFFRVFKAFRE